MSSTTMQEFWPTAKLSLSQEEYLASLTTKRDEYLASLTTKSDDVQPVTTVNVSTTKVPYTVTRPGQPVNDIANTLAQRGDRYGKFTGHARITQELKRVIVESKNWKILTADQKESLEMICHKMGRILNGDPNYDDSWIDIAGYAKLVADRLSSGQET